MNKKDSVFIATISMLENRFPNFDPEDSIEENKKFSKSFITLYHYLAAVYEDCP